ncbi:MAG: hypothetical protein EOP46_01985 [Sphingobacteriaceae bacterium]|nr:MAG: hypothetical protein EOP46_01985 [Sphingobacteriaceae bacterium]
MKKLVYYFLGLALLVSACKKNDELTLPDNLVNFSVKTLGLGAEDDEAEVTLQLGRTAETEVKVELELLPGGVTYGTHFTTEPAAVNNKLTLTIPAGSTSAKFKVIKADGILLNGDETINFTLKTVSGGSQVVLGGDTELKLSFSSIVSEGAELTLQGGEGASAAVNSVYVDLSANQQSSVVRKSWDLGFFSGADFRVRINNTTAASAVMVDKTDINAVTAADVDLDALALGFGFGTLDVVDDTQGDLTKTVIGEVSATEGNNKVYVINRVATGAAGVPADLIKVRILRNGNDYTLQYAKLEETTFKTLTVQKSATANFTFVSFDTDGVVTVEPAKDRWDFVWGYSVYFTNFGTGLVPYAFSDLVFANHLGDVETAEVLTSTVSYDAFAEANLSAVTLTKNRNTIGSGWRATTGAVGVKADRFYVIKDAAGNVYKLKFISFTTQDGGVRGYPKLQYALVKKGE